MEVAQFFGQTLTVGAIATGVTQIFKLADEVLPSIKQIPVVGKGLGWLVDTITPEDPAAIRIFVAVLCFALNILGIYLQTGHVEINLLLMFATFKSFLDSSGMYVLLKPQLQQVNDVATEKIEEKIKDPQ